MQLAVSCAPSTEACTAKQFLYLSVVIIETAAGPVCVLPRWPARQAEGRLSWPWSQLSRRALSCAAEAACERRIRYLEASPGTA